MYKLHLLFFTSWNSEVTFLYVYSLLWRLFLFTLLVSFLAFKRHGLWKFF